MAIIVGLIVLACVIVLIGVALRISAAILRGAVGLTNAVMGGREPHEDDYRRASYDYNPVPQPKSLAGLRVPMPGVGYAILINIGGVVASTIAQLGATLGLSVVLAGNGPMPADPTDPQFLGTQLLIAGVGFLVGVCATIVVLKMALPTTYVRATVVAFFQFLISMALAVALGFALVFFSGIQISDVPNARPTGGGGGWVR